MDRRTIKVCKEPSRDECLSAIKMTLIRFGAFVQEMDSQRYYSPRKFTVEHRDFLYEMLNRRYLKNMDAVLMGKQLEELDDEALETVLEKCRRLSDGFGLCVDIPKKAGVVNKIRPSGAWIVKNSWTECFIKQYQTFVLTNAKVYIEEDEKEENEKEKYTCEDFALALLIDFSVKNNLPVVIRGNRDIYDSRNPKYNSIIKFKKTVFDKNAANHLMENTVPIDVSDAKPGDLILMDTGLYGGKRDDIINHVIVITKIDGDFFLLAQGNHTGKDVKRAYYKTNNYQGMPVESRKYNWKTDVYYGSGDNEYPDAIKGFGMQFRRWNFKGMEK